MKPTFVYWNHLPEHTDPSSEGYIGVTKSPMMRECQHRESTNSPCYAFRHDSVFEILHEVPTREEAYKIEQQYRPSRNIGWNKKAGGSGYRGYKTRQGKNKGVPHRLFNIKIEEELLLEFKSECYKSGISMSKQIKDLIREHIKHRQITEQMELF